MLRVDVAHPVGTISLELSFTVGPSCCLALAGPSGAGKTTVLRLLAGTSRPLRGRISLDDEVWLDTETGTFVDPERRRCGYVHQDYALFPHLSAWRNVAYGLRGVPRSRRQARAVTLLERFGMAEKAHARPATLSGGERQRVALARALATEPALLLLDEPLSALDARNRGAATRVLEEVIGSLAIPVVLVTHDFFEAAQLADDVAVIDAGRIAQRGTASQLAAQPASAFVADFTGAVVLSGTAEAAGDLTRVALDGGGTLSSTDSASGRVAITVYPWELTLAPWPVAGHDSAQNHLRARVTSLTTLGNRVRVGLHAGQPFAAEITTRSAQDLALVVGQEIGVGFKATATRVVAL
jgi:molybdate transport system ATP-binding protein